MDAIRVTTQEATIELLDLFQKHGHNEVDTARMYTNGTSEEMLGVIGWQVRLQLFHLYAFSNGLNYIGARYQDGHQALPDQR